MHFLSLCVMIVAMTTLDIVWCDCSSRDSPPQRITDICKNCSDLPEHLLECEDVYDYLAASENATFRAVNGYGCQKMGGTSHSKVETTKVVCKPLEEFYCYYDPEHSPVKNLPLSKRREERLFLSSFEKPCIRYTGHYFQTTLIFSLLLGFLGVDRFCLGWTGIGVGKMLTIGGLGVWWIIDIILLITGNLKPNDDSNWETLY